MKKPKIAILVPRYGIVDRGVEIFTKELVSFLGARFEFEIFSWRSFFSDFKPQKSHTEFEMFAFSILCFAKLLFGKFNLIFPQNGFWGALICRIIRATRGTPYIYRSAGGKEPMIVRQKPDVYVATTPEIKNWIEKFDSKQKVVLIPNGVNTNKFEPKGKKINLSLEKPIFLCVGALIPAKRIDHAIKAVAKLEKGSLLVLGDGVLEKDIKMLGNRILGVRRFLLKEVKYEKIPSYYRACDVFTLPSLDEPFGIVYLEAMASNLPVVAPDDKSREYIVGKAGVLCNVTNVKEYVDALRLATKKDFDDKPKKQAKKFDWNIVSRKYGNIINSLIISSG